MTHPDSPEPAPADAPIDAEFEEAPPPPPGRARASSGAAMLWVLLGTLAIIVALALGFVALRNSWFEAEPAVPGTTPAAQPVADETGPAPDPAPTPAPDPAQVEAAARDPQDAADEALQQELEALRAEVADLRAQMASAAGPGPDDAALTRRVTSLEDAAPNVARNEERLDIVEERLAEFADRLDQAPARDDIAALEARVEAAETRAARSPAEAAYRLAALREAASRGAPFEEEHAALARLRPNDAELAAMADSATSGVPTLEELRRSYPADAIRDALAAAPEDDTGRFAWLRRLFGRVATVRRADGDPGAAERAVDAAEAALAAGDLETAIEETQRLGGNAADEADYWLGRAQARARLNARVDAVQDALAAEAAQ